MKIGSAFTVVAVIVIFFGLLFAVVIYQNFRVENYSKIKYEYDTLKSYLNLPDDVLNKLLYGSRITGNLKLVEVIQSDDKTIFIVSNGGDIPLTGFKITFNDFTVLPRTVPYILPPYFDGAIILESNNIAGAGTVTISTDQGVALRILRSV